MRRSAGSNPPPSRSGVGNVRNSDPRLTVGDEGAGISNGVWF